ncbi:hypothetical protein BpHYR1_053722 [Brachionus plicatilis]|uniref:Uncharacterized protein n=1 Tax=Brachionus plicatilis TaxID=10195 RepID=A0A3M7Q408_BRAPC|nr:hypothetical protein BpHYR1_053722 [Brachionus plicatilis]
MCSIPKFIPIFNYLLETSQIYGILKSLWNLNNNETMIMADCSLGTVLDWAWSKVCVVKKELNNLNEKICLQLKNHFNRHPTDPIERDNLSEFLNRENNMLDNLIQIFKQFIKLNSTSEGHDQLNKKLCSLESIKCFVEHLILFNKFELLLPPSASSHDTDLNDSSCLFKNYLNEIEGNFKIIQNRCSKRRLEQTNHKYPFTHMIDCLIEECRPFANVSKFFLKNKKQVKFSDQGNRCDSDDLNSIYPPKSILELLEICLECNLSTKMKQMLILYVLSDLMHTEMSDSVKKHSGIKFRYFLNFD